MQSNDKNYYFTFGTNKAHPYQKGWIVITAPSMQHAVDLFQEELFPEYHQDNKNTVKCAFIYSEDDFQKTDMYENGNMGVFCHAHYAYTKHGAIVRHGAVMKDEPTILRLLLTDLCGRNCPGCCNHQWDLTKLAVCKDFTPYKMVILTGGEPMLKPDLITGAIRRIKEQNTTAHIILYTADVTDLPVLTTILPLLDGITVTVHHMDDWIPLYQFDKALKDAGTADRLSLRLNIFDEAQTKSPKCQYDRYLGCNWTIKDHITWIPNCPLPVNETFMRFQ